MNFSALMRHLTSFLVIVLMVTVSCRHDTVKVSGRINFDCQSEPVLELVTSSGAVTTDTISLNKHGDFKIKVIPPYAGPNLYSLNINNNRIPLLLSAGERVTLKLDGLMPVNYSVRGSAESQLLREVKQMMDDGTLRLDSLLNVARSESGVAQDAILRQYASEYARLKQQQIKFIVANSASMAAIYALYQHFPVDDIVGFKDNDIIYFRLVADSVRKHYPSSPYLAAVDSYVRSVDSGTELLRMIDESISNPSPYPDITLTDMFGNSHTLSDLHGNIILLDFWIAGPHEASIRNAELKNIYSRYPTLGFEIYQVGLNDSKKDWVNAVHMQQLPWISVCDFRGLDGYAPRIYNVSAPDNFLISADGDIIAHNLTVDELHRKIQELLPLSD